MSGRKVWTLSFDGERFDLRPAEATAPSGLARDRLVEENLETLLLHWGHELLPGMPVHVLSRSSTIMSVADLCGVDALGRLHLFELKKDSANDSKHLGA